MYMNVNRGNAKKITQIGMMGAIAMVLMLFEMPLPFFPSFYEMDLSEVPVLIGAFTMGPVAGILIELVKILLNLLINGTITAGVGEFANFIIGCGLCVPAALVYRKFHTKAGALAGLISGTVIMTILSCFINAYVVLPLYMKAFGWDASVLVGMGNAVNGNITSMLTFVLFAVAPFNLIKGILASTVVMLIYKRISPILKQGRV